MNKILKSMMVLGLGAMMVGCSSSTENESGSTGGAINVITREDGSGTRGAFIELFGVEEDDVDNTISTAEITNSTSVMLTTVEGNENAIGYVSLGSLSDTVKALSIDGVEPTTDNVKSGDYTVTRPFLICTMGEDLDELTQDFIDFIMSEQGQEVVSEEGYIAQDTTTTYEASGVSGSITVGGSSSVTPVMEKLAEAYQELNPDAEISVQQTDSTTGATSTIDGTYNIGMCSRELKPEEEEQGLVATTIATDGIAVIVNSANEISNLTAEQVKQIYVGEITDWSEVE